MSVRFPATCLALLLMSLASAVADEPADSTHEERVRVVVTEIPVQVVRDGQPVRGLTAGDFEVLDNGKPQPIVGFDVRDVTTIVPGRPTSDGTASVAARRRFLFLFDFAFSDARALLRARESALQIAREQAHPSDLIGVATYRPTTGAKLLLNFTTDRAQVEAAIGSLQSSGEQLASDPLGLTIVAPDLMGGGLALPGSDGGRGSDEAMRIMQVTANNADRRSRQQQVSKMTQDLAEFAKVLGTIEGRKDVFYFSAGFDNSLIFASQDAAKIREMNQARESGEHWRIDQSERFGDLAQQSSLDQMLRNLRQAGCVVHAIDLGTLVAADTDSAARTSVATGGNHALSMMASETGGNYSRNSNDFDSAIASVLETTSVTYVLAIQPKGIKSDGRFHRLKVRLKGPAREKNTRVTHRTGYYAPTPYREKSARERTLLVAGRLFAEREGGAIPTSVLAVPFDMPGADKSFVPVLVEIDGPSLIEQAIAGRTQLQLFAYAFDDTGRILDMFTQTLGVDVEQAGTILQRSGLKYYGSLELPAGDHELRVMVVGADSGLSHLSIVPLTVPRAGTQLLPPLFPDPRGKWVLARQPDADGATAFPFVADGIPFLPAAAPKITTDDEESTVYLIGMLPESEAPLELHARLFDAAGDEIPCRAFRAERRQAAAVAGYDVVVASLAPGVAPGRYELQIRLGENTTSSIPVVVTE